MTVYIINTNRELLANIDAFYIISPFTINTNNYTSLVPPSSTLFFYGPLTILRPSFSSNSMMEFSFMFIGPLKVIIYVPFLMIVLSVYISTFNPPNSLFMTQIIRSICL